MEQGQRKSYYKGYTQEQNERVQEYQRTNMEQLNLRYQKSLNFKALCTERAHARGLSLAQYIRACVLEEVERNQ